MATLVAGLVKYNNGRKVLASFTIDVEDALLKSFAVRQRYAHSDPADILNSFLETGQLHPGLFTSCDFGYYYFSRSSIVNRLHAATDDATRKTILDSLKVFERLLVEATMLVPKLVKFKETLVVPLFAYGDDGTMYKFSTYSISRILRYNGLTDLYILKAATGKVMSGVDKVTTENILGNLKDDNPWKDSNVCNTG